MYGENIIEKEYTLKYRLLKFLDKIIKIRIFYTYNMIIKIKIKNVQRVSTKNYHSSSHKL